MRGQEALLTAGRGKFCDARRGPAPARVPKIEKLQRPPIRTDADGEVPPLFPRSVPPQYPLATVTVERGSGRGGERGARAIGDDAADAGGLHPLLHHPHRPRPHRGPPQPDRLHARLHQTPSPQEAGDRGGAQLVRPPASAPLHCQHRRRRAPNGRRRGLGIGICRRALHGGRHARHRGPRLARVPHRLHPVRPRWSGRLLLPHAPRHLPPRLRRRGARLPAEHTQRLLTPSSSSSPRGGEEKAGGEGPGEGGHEEEEEAHGAAAHAPVP